MQKNIHPEKYNIEAKCSCGNSFKVISTKKSMNLTLCSKCHPFYLGNNQIIDTEGRIDKFKNKYTNIKSK